MLRNWYLAACLAPLLVAGCGEPEGAAPGRAPPEISALDLEDKQHRLSDYLGRVLVLNFWSSGCGPCIAEMPHMDSLFRQYREDGLTVLGINQGEEPQEVEAAIRRLGVSYPIAIDQLGISAKRYRVKAVPATFVLDRGGMLRKKVLGEISRESLEAMVTPLLGVEASALADDDRNSATSRISAAGRTVAAFDASGGDAVVGGQLYRSRCLDCHGRNADKRAMDRSKSLRELSAGQIATTLKNYQFVTVTTQETRFKAGLSDPEIRGLVAYLLDVRSDPDRPPSTAK